jgi:hypothetical protein
MSGKLIPRADGSSTLPSSTSNLDPDRDLSLDWGLTLRDGVAAAATKLAPNSLQPSIVANILDRNRPTRIMNLFFQLIASCDTIFEQFGRIPEGIGMNAINAN